MAKAYFHSTSQQAAEVAKEAQVKQLILTHISARYLTKEAYQLQEEAQEIFPNTKIVKIWISLRFHLPMKEELRWI